MSPTINTLIDTSVLAHFRIPPPPSGLKYPWIIKPSLSIMIIELVGTSILLPSLVILFFFSTKELKPIFILNVISILLGMSLGTTGICITNPHRPVSPGVYGVIGCFIALVPLFVETILVLRILAVHPLPPDAEIAVHTDISATGTLEDR
ncbi:hypothetical protein AMATHDRAFT_154538 [Amanita thiersii Skay4041]|uniref:Uncharacterized protein n=1 Tax=Amanita thiersii Skay4041 TaxID=703135 RepID=A0A2A9NFQ4_9AGAR|nr:hypothetical protein AMATHDRAFT_154538 [Amanita thiersii Skay4041]